MTVYVFDTRTQAFRRLDWVGSVDEKLLSSLGYKLVKEEDGDRYFTKHRLANKEETKKALFEYASFLQNLGSC